MIMRLFPSGWELFTTCFDRTVPLTDKIYEEKAFILDKMHVISYNSLLQMNKLQARSSGGERYLDTVEVGGSKPPGPTMITITEILSMPSNI